MRRTQFGFSENFSKKVRVTAYGALLLITAIYLAPPSFADFDSDAEASADASAQQISESMPASDDSVRDALRSVFKETAPERIKEFRKESAKAVAKPESAANKSVATEKRAPGQETAEKESVTKEAVVKEAVVKEATVKENEAKEPAAKATINKTATKPSPPSANHKIAFTGVADYYADMFHGRKTASGQLHDKTKMTAAHLSLPFGTKVKVVSRHTGKSCVVTVNDRGPYTKNRIIDLSLAAAKELGLVTAGSRLVDCYLIEPE